jgi:hypothetical protein
MIRILLAWWFWITNRNNELAKSRLVICAGCDKRRWVVCGVCGCPLQTKARLEEEECPHPSGNKWKNPDNRSGAF